MKTIVLIIVLQFIVTLLTGCAEFETKMEEMKSEQITCQLEDQTLCAGWKI